MQGGRKRWDAGLREHYAEGQLRAQRRERVSIALRSRGLVKFPGWWWGAERRHRPSR